MTSNFYPVLIKCNIMMLQCVLNLQENSLFAALTSFSVLPYHVSLYLMSCLYISLCVWVAKTSLMKTLPFTLFFSCLVCFAHQRYLYKIHPQKRHKFFDKRKVYNIFYLNTQLEWKTTNEVYMSRVKNVERK